MINPVARSSSAIVWTLAAIFILVGTNEADAQQFREVDDYGWGRGENFTAPFLIDLDGNGLLDLIVGTERSGLLRWEQTALNGTQFHRIKRDFMDSQVETKVAPVYHDIDGDGKLDLLLMTESGYIDHYIQNELNHPDFTLHEKRFSGIKVWSAGRFWLGDLDGNGLLDIIAGSSQQTLQRYEQTSKQSFAFEQRRDVSIQSATYYLAPALYDIDGDGLLEMFLGGQDSRLRLLRQHEVVKDSFLLVSEIWNGIDDLECGTPVIGDIDNDGLLDLVIGSKGGLIRHYKQTESNEVDDWQLHSDNVLGTMDFGLQNQSLVCDLDGDGLLDILRTDVPVEVGARERPVQHFRQTAAGALTLEHLGEFSGIVAGIHDKLGITENNQDGLLELFVLRLNGGMEQYRQRLGQPFVFDLVTEHALPDVQWTYPPYPCFVDVDGNGKLDLLLFYPNTQVSRLEQEAPGSARFIMLDDDWMRAPDQNPSAHILDYDNDGTLDMILGGYRGVLHHYKQTAPHATTFIPGSLDFGMIDVRHNSQPMMTDVNNDGKLDLVVGDGAGGLSLYINEGPMSITVDDAASADFHISQLAPNPCSGPVLLMIETTSSRSVTVSLYDLLGREVLRPVDGVLMDPGRRQIAFDVQALPVGFYSIVASTEGHHSTAVLVKQ